MTDLPPVSEAPWRAGWHSARTTFKPGLVLISAAVVLVLAYSGNAAVRHQLDAFAAFRLRGGYVFSAAMMLLFAGVLPFCFLRWTSRGAHPWHELLFGAVFWAYRGVEIDAFYRLLSWSLGNGQGWDVVARKVAIDQLAYNPGLAAPMAVLLYAWKDGGYAWAAPLADLRRGGWYARRVLPALIAVWGVWIPGTACIYSLPFGLQQPVVSLMCCYWVTLFSHLAARQNRPGAGADPK